MPSVPKLPTINAIPPLKFKFVAGAAAGNITVAGVKKDDQIVAVIAFGLTEGTPNTFSGFADLTSEFSATATDTINNTGGTSSANKMVMVVWAQTANALGSS